MGGVCSLTKGGGVNEVRLEPQMNDYRFPKTPKFTVSSLSVEETGNMELFVTPFIFSKLI